MRKKNLFHEEMFSKVGEKTHVCGRKKSLNKEVAVTAF